MRPIIQEQKGKEHQADVPPSPSPADQQKGDWLVLDGMRQRDLGSVQQQVVQLKAVRPVGSIAVSRVGIAQVSSTVKDRHRLHGRQLILFTW